MNQERSWIEKIKADWGAHGTGTLVGIGDDAAVLSAAGNPVVVTTDMMVEGVHFDLRYLTPENVGHRLLTANLSDLAAMGATPSWFLVSLAVRKGLSWDFVERLYTGMRSVAEPLGVDLVGGNITVSPRQLVLDVTAMGLAPKQVLRNGARAGQKLGMTGFPGRASAARTALDRNCGNAKSNHPEVVKHFLSPVARVSQGVSLNQAGLVSAMMDVSDGVASSIHELCRASGCGANLVGCGNDVPLSKLCNELSLSFEQLWWFGGEEYELLFAFDPENEQAIRNLIQPLPLQILGIVTESDSVSYSVQGNIQPLPDSGWDPFL